MSQVHAKSVGHVGFHSYPDGEVVEFLTRGEDYFRAPVSNPVDTTGCRFGRFECTASTWPLLLRILGGRLNGGV